MPCLAERAVGPSPVVKWPNVLSILLNIVSLFMSRGSASYRNAFGSYNYDTTWVVSGCLEHGWAEIGHFLGLPESILIFVILTNFVHVSRNIGW